MPGFCNGNIIATLQSPLLTYLLFQIIMKLAEDIRHLVFVFSEYRTPRYSATLIVHRNHRAMNMWICLIKVNVEAYNVVFAKTFRHKIINVLCPTLNVLSPAQMRVVRSFFKTYFLTAESQIEHPFTAATKDKLGESVLLTSDIRTVVRVFDAS